MGFTLICELVQETPMIHFQYNENGACIRASELKPKLDRFIIKYYDDSKVIPDEWCLRNEDQGEVPRALNYKVKIEAPEEYKLWNKNELQKLGYFANMGSKSENKLGILYKNRIKLTILCFIPSLLKEIEKRIEGFFLLNNFGARQSKGFGSFCIKKVFTDGGEREFKGGKRLLDEVKKYYKIPLYGYRYKKGENEEKLKDIRIIYGLMKGGFNFTKNSQNDYYKGFIFRYFMKNPHRLNNDKAFMKGYIFDSIKDEEYFYVRALLGISERYKFKDKKNNDIEILVKNKEIERFQSPVTFKIFGQYMVMLIDEDFKCILDKEFEFSIKGKKKRAILTPKEFDLLDFIEAFVEDFNSKKGVDGRNDLNQIQCESIRRAKEIKLEQFI